MSTPDLAETCDAYGRIAPRWGLPELHQVRLAVTPVDGSSAAAAWKAAQERIDAGWSGWLLLQSSGPRIVVPGGVFARPADEHLLMAELADPDGLKSLALRHVHAGAWRGALLRETAEGRPMLAGTVRRLLDRAVATRALAGAAVPEAFGAMLYRRYWGPHATDGVLRPLHARFISFSDAAT